MIYYKYKYLVTVQIMRFYNQKYVVDDRLYGVV